jgi:hypothetical protein
MGYILVTPHFFSAFLVFVAQTTFCYKPTIFLVGKLSAIFQCHKSLLHYGYTGIKVTVWAWGALEKTFITAIL